MTGDKAIRRTTIAAVAIVAVVAAWVSYRHALHVVSEHGETGWLARAYPLTIDGLIVAASMVLLTAARQRVRAHWLAYGALGLGITATIAVNVAAGLAFGTVGAVIAAWPAPALVISFELLMIVIRAGSPRAPATAPRERQESTRAPGRRAPKNAPRRAPVTEFDAESEFADLIASGAVPSKRAIRSRLRVGDKAADRLHEHLSALVTTK